MALYRLLFRVIFAIISSTRQGKSPPLLDLVDELVSVAEDEEKLANAPEVAYPMYRTQADYAERCPHAKRLPYLGMYQMAVAQAAMLVRSDGQAPYVECI